MPPKKKSLQMVMELLEELCELIENLPPANKVQDVSLYWMKYSILNAKKYCKDSINEEKYDNRKVIVLLREDDGTREVKDPEEIWKILHGTEEETEDERKYKWRKALRPSSKAPDTL